MMLFSSSLYASKPLAGIVGFKAAKPMISSISNQVWTHVINIVDSTGIFSVVNPVLLEKELTKFDCLEEKCVLSFARTAGINLIIGGRLEERGNAIAIDLYSYGIDAPYFGRVIYKYVVEISKNEFYLSPGQIIEEHAAYFVSGLLAKYKALAFLKKDADESFIIDTSEIVSGDYALYRYDNIKSVDDNLKIYNKIGTIHVANSRVKKIDVELSKLADGDFIFITYDNKATFLEEFYYGRKREIVFKGPSLKNDLFLLLSTVPASALMPIIAPIGHYRFGDFTGLSLWALSALPYLYLEYDGLKNRSDTYREDRRDISGKSVTRFRFGLYMLFCGGMPLLVDVLAHRQLHLASNYQKAMSVMGNRISTVYLSLVSGGGGHFYKGHRYTGYLYFHLHNALVYSVIREFSPGETYCIGTNSYKKDKINKNRAYTYLGVFGFVKIIEISHALLVNDEIRNGMIKEESFSFEPDIMVDGENGLTIGARYTSRF